MKVPATPEKPEVSFGTKLPPNLVHELKMACVKHKLSVKSVVRASIERTLGEMGERE